MAKPKVAVKNDVTLKDSLYNTALDRTEYGKGIVVGSVAAFMSIGLNFNEAWKLVQEHLPNGWRAECVPDCWPTPQRKEATNGQ